MIKKLIYLLVLFISVHFAEVNAATNPKVDELVCEYLKQPVGIDVLKPRLSWKITSSERNTKQTAYEIRCASSMEALKKRRDLLWHTGKVRSDNSVNIEYGGAQPVSLQRIYWQVRIWDNKNRSSAWSTPSFWEMGLLSTGDWSTAEWITKEELKSEKSLPCQYYRTEFSTTKQVKQARLCVTSLGTYQAFLNGKKVGDQLFTPGFTSYTKRLQYQVYDITSMLEKENALGAIVGDGWYRGNLGWMGERAIYGNQLGLLAQLHIVYTDGSNQRISTNANWKSSYGPIIRSDIYNGELYDKRKELSGWSRVNYDDSQWERVKRFNHSKDILVASNGLKVRAIQELKPVDILTTPKGETVLDLGQNMVGWVRMKVKGNAGDKVTIQYAEVLDKHGNFFTENLRSADATDTYILDGKGEEIFEPHFTFHGFRYVKLIDYPGNLTADKITGIVIHSDMKPTGQFSCSDSLINQLQSNLQWGQKDNFLDIPTDCPQRDERVGWTGDTQVFSKTAAFNFGVAPFYTKWLKDLAADQQPNGEVPNIIPDMWHNKFGGATGWADAAVIVPWSVYCAYGDRRILEEQYASMKAWVEYMERESKGDGLWDEPHFHWGDWLSFHSDKPAYPGAYTETDLIATAYFCYSSTLMEKIAGILGKTDDAEYYKDLVHKIKTAFSNEYITAGGRLVSNTQTAYALAIAFDLIPEDVLPDARRHFSKEVKRFKHLTTGFLGTPLLCSSLSKINRDDLAFLLLNRKTYPSWLYPVTQGATTIWERWDTQKPDGTIIDGMNSFNHYAYGAIGEWLYNHVAGISLDPEQPGYKHILFSPHPGGGLTRASASIETMYGEASSSWEIKDNVFYYELKIPVNTTASLSLPDAVNKTIYLDGKPMDANVQLGSGEYVISYSMN